MPSTSITTPAKFYRRRDPEASPFYKLVTEHTSASSVHRFDEFERVYPERFGMHYGLSFHS